MALRLVSLCLTSLRGLEPERGSTIPKPFEWAGLPHRLALVLPTRAHPAKQRLRLHNRRPPLQLDDCSFGRWWGRFYGLVVCERGVLPCTFWSIQRRAAIDPLLPFVCCRPRPALQELLTVQSEESFSCRSSSCLAALASRFARSSSRYR